MFLLKTENVNQTLGSHSTDVCVCVYVCVYVCVCVCVCVFVHVCV